MKRVFIALLLLFCAFSSQAINRVWTNTLGGDWFGPFNWSPHGSPSNNDNVFITNSGTYTVSELTNLVSISGLTLGGGSGTQTLLYGVSLGALGAFTITNSGTVGTNGVLTVTNSGLAGSLVVAPGGQLNLGGGSTLYLYDFNLTNQGTVTWSGSSLEGGDTTVSNGGLWQMTGDDTVYYGGYSAPLFINGGTLRKLTGTGTTGFDDVDLVNLPSGLVDIQTGTFDIEAAQTNDLSGSFNTTASSTITFSAGSFTDAGGTTSGGGSFKFNGGNFYLRTNIIAGIQFIYGNIYITGTHTFQKAGAITNLTLEGATLNGTNQVAGTLTVNSGYLVGELTVQPGAQFLMPTSGSIYLYNLTLNNQGTVTWGPSGVTGGNTVISNGGTWLLTSDNALGWGGYAMPVWTNSGTLRKTGGTASSQFGDVQFVNQPSGVVEVDTATLEMPINYTNLAGELRLNGGQFQAFEGNLTLIGGTLDGTGGVGPNELLGGTLSPGLAGPGELGFPQGLNLGSNATLVISGTGTTPGSQYSQLAVTGAVALADCNLQVTSLPSVPVGTTFAIITNSTGSAVSGTFNGLPESSILNVSGQSFQIHYAGGPGNNVTLVRVGAGGPAISYDGFTNGNWRLAGSGAAATLFTVQATTNFLSWTNVGTITSDGSGNFIFIDTNAPKFRYRFYRTTN